MRFKYRKTAVKNTNIIVKCINFIRDYFGEISEVTFELVIYVWFIYLCIVVIYFIYRMLMSKEQDNFLNRVRHAITLPIRTRCAELTVLLDRGNTIELQNFFPLLLDNIFGPQGSISWGLRCVTNIEEDFRQLQHFLSPCGPVFKLIYTLLKDPSVRYDFPVVYLPTKVQQMLENAQSHPFYADLIHVNPQTKRVIALLLNPFDYYMFHFAFHLINPWHQRIIATVPNSWNTVYYVLCCDYMLHFLPTNPANQVLPQIIYYGKNPMLPVSPTNPLRSHIGSKLINTSFLNQSIEEYNFHQQFGRHPRNEIWRSETVLTVFIDMWLNNDQVSQVDNQMNNSLNISQVPRLLQFTELPSPEYMRIVRVLMKQLHSFAASAKIDDTNMCELKKIAIPMLQGKFYVFLRNLIHRWPLDGSFRLVLELWLTYIQPWRYPANPTQKDLAQQNSDLEDINQTAAPSVDRDFLPFIVENLLIFVVIFQQLLPRFSRVDLISPKMSVMLYRITKVFSQSNLAQLLQEIESSIDNNHSPSRSFGSNWSSHLPPLNPTVNWCTNTTATTEQQNQWTLNNLNADYARKNGTDAGHSFVQNFFSSDKKWAVIIRQKICELEGPSFVYKPLFSAPPAPEVFDLILQIKKSIKVSQEIVEVKQNEERQLHATFWGFIKSIFEVPTTTDEFTLNERLKVPKYLEISLQNLVKIFQITEVPEPELESSASTTASGFEVSNDFKFLSPFKVRERIKKIKYEGDPDLHPIRSTEIAFLVRMFYQLATKVNQKYGDQFCELYYNPTYWGRLSRQILQPPTTIYRFDKTRPGSPRISEELPPRISFRSLATFRFVGYLTLGALTAKALGYSVTFYVLLIIFLCFVYKSFKAIFSTSVRHNYPTQGFGNISFNDSFQ